jgi:hypothetical protein
MGQEGTRLRAEPPLSTPNENQSVPSVLGGKAVDEAMAVKKIFDVARLHVWFFIQRI